MVSLGPYQTTENHDPYRFFKFMPDILLIQPPICDFYLTAKRTIPYGLACIAGSLIKGGFSVEIFDSLATSRSRVIEAPREMAYLGDYYGRPDRSPFGLFHDFRHFGYSFDHIGEVARQSKALLVGISSLFTAYSGEALETARIVKKFHPGCKVVLGGHHATEMPDEVMKCEAVDFVLRGEGEFSMVELARAIQEGRPVESVPGIVFRMQDRTIKKNEPATMDFLDEAAPPAISLFKHRFYQRKGRTSMVVVASRGCPQKCSYCSLGASSYARYRKRSVESVLGEIEEGVTKYGAGFIDFEDENISVDRKWFLTLLREIKKRFFAWNLELRAMNGLYPPTLDDELIAGMKEAGFRALNLALATTSPEQLKRFKRPDVRKSFDCALAAAKKHGLEAVGYIIAGAPGQDPNDSLKDLLFLAARPVLAGLSIYYPSPGSEDFKACERQGILPKHPSLMRSTALPISDSTTREQSVTLLRLARILNFMKLPAAQEKSIPRESDPAAFGQIGDMSDRMEIGRALLARFFKDGIIRGVTPEGQVFEHKACRELSMQFIAGLKTVAPA